MADATQNPGFLQGQWPMIAQYLAAAGEDIGAGKPIGTNVNKVTQQNIASQNYTKMLQKLLAGGGKITADKDNVNIKAPVGAFNQQSADPVAATMTAPSNLFQVGGSPTPSPAATQDQSTQLMSTMLGGAASIPNPTASPLGEISAADLAGLTPQDITQAIGVKTTQDELVRRYNLDVAKEGLAQQRLDIDAFKALKDKETADITNYRYAVSQGFKGTLQDYQADAKSGEKITMYRQAKNEGYPGNFMEFLEDYGRMTKPETNIINKLDEKVQTAEALKGVENRNYFVKPGGGLEEDLRKFMTDDKTDMQLYMQKIAPGTPEFAAKKQGLAVSFVGEKLRSTYGKDAIKKIRISKDGSKATWVVDTGKGIKEYTYGIKY